MTNKPEGRPTELVDVIEQAREAAEERLRLIYKSVFTGKPMEEGQKVAPMPIERPQ